MTTETPVQQQTRLEHAKIGPIFRNNVGACEDQTGRQIRYGLGNDSAQMNRVIKSSDLIGITPTLILPHMVGYYLGVFTAYEVKRSGWTFPNPTNVAEFARASAQRKFHDIVREACGFAGFVTDPNDIHGIIGR